MESLVSLDLKEQLDLKVQWVVQELREDLVLMDLKENKESLDQQAQLVSQETKAQLACLVRMVWTDPQEYQEWMETMENQDERAEEGRGYI